MKKCCNCGSERDVVTMFLGRRYCRKCTDLIGLGNFLDTETGKIYEAADGDSHLLPKTEV